MRKKWPLPIPQVKMPQENTTIESETFLQSTGNSYTSIVVLCGRIDSKDCTVQYQRQSSDATSLIFWGQPLSPFVERDNHLPANAGQLKDR